jgi:hypothetical protein
MSPIRAAPRPLITTSVLAVAITYGPQCGIPGSPNLAAAGIKTPKKSWAVIQL